MPPRTAPARASAAINAIKNAGKRVAPAETVAPKKKAPAKKASKWAKHKAGDLVENGTKKLYTVTKTGGLVARPIAKAKRTAAKKASGVKRCTDARLKATGVRAVKATLKAKTPSKKGKRAGQMNGRSLWMMETKTGPRATEKWTSMSDSGKAKWTAKAVAANKKVREERKDPNRKKGPLSNFMRFGKAVRLHAKENAAAGKKGHENYASVYAASKAGGQTVGIGQAGKAIGSLWKMLHDDEKAEWKWDSMVLRPRLP
jgi:hypothetical protein